MAENERQIILKKLIDDFFHQIEEKEARMRAWLSLVEYPNLQQAEQIDHMISGFLAPITLLQQRNHTDRNKEQWVEQQLVQIMQKYNVIKENCNILLSRLVRDNLSEDEIDINIIRLINQKQFLFKPTVADLQMAALMGDLDKYGFEIKENEQGEKVIAQKK